LRVVTIICIVYVNIFLQIIFFFFPIFTWTVHFLGIFTWIVKFVFHFLQFFFVFFFLHYLHEESFSFLHCFYYCVTIHMNSEPFFYNPYFSLLVFFFLFSCTTHMNNPFLFFFFFALLLQLMSLFKWIVHLFSIFFQYSHDRCNFQNCLHEWRYFFYFFSCNCFALFTPTI